ncbi:Xylose isomerase [Klebsiella pneumoniae]|uniref:Xylose isomerase n=1 Tax=Klebsiella pneumoniae TaxID=573 RepID=A0A4P0XKZ4_KLEPN|nr:Xylose isomerase [Klebsiella pneumoniae]
MIEDGKLDQGLAKRYAGWQGELGQKIMSGQMSLDNIARYAEQHNLNPQPQSGASGITRKSRQYLYLWLIFADMPPRGHVFRRLSAAGK